MQGQAACPFPGARRQSSCAGAVRHRPQRCRRRGPDGPLQRAARFRWGCCPLTRHRAAALRAGCARCGCHGGHGHSDRGCGGHCAGRCLRHRHAGRHGPAALRWPGWLPTGFRPQRRPWVHRRAGPWGSAACWLLVRAQPALRPTGVHGVDVGRAALWPRRCCCAARAPGCGACGCRGSHGLRGSRAFHGLRAGGGRCCCGGCGPRCCVQRCVRCCPRAVRGCAQCAHRVHCCVHRCARRCVCAPRCCVRRCDGLGACWALRGPVPGPPRGPGCQSQTGF